MLNRTKVKKYISVKGKTEKTAIKEIAPMMPVRIVTDSTLKSSYETSIKEAKHKCPNIIEIILGSQNISPNNRKNPKNTFSKGNQIPKRELP